MGLPSIYLSLTQLSSKAEQKMDFFPYFLLRSTYNILRFHLNAPEETNNCFKLVIFLTNRNTRAHRALSSEGSSA